MRAEYICPVLTAFDENGKVDMEAMKRQFDHLIEGGLNGIAIMGSSGEFYAMTLEVSSTRWKTARPSST